MDTATKKRPKKYLMVCTGNTCRSPMAYGWFRDKMKSLGYDVEVDSCGISAVDGKDASVESLKLLQELEIDISDFRTQIISKEKIEWADRIIAMSPSHREYILSQFPTVSPDRINVLNVPDPVGQNIDAYRKSFSMIKDGLKKEIKKLVTIAIGSDHGGFDLKQRIVQDLINDGYDVDDVGTKSKESCDYPDFAFAVAEKVAKNKSVRGILICTSGGGIAVAANKVKGIRAVPCFNKEDAEFARRHNNMNILVLSGKKTNPTDGAEMAKLFLSTDFDGGRHERRVGKIETYEEKHWKGE